MPSRASFPFPAYTLQTTPMLAWMPFAMGYSAMLQSSAVVIAHRLARMAAAGPQPGVRDQREFIRMVQEKPQAVAESMQAVMMKMMMLPLQQSTLMTQQMTAAMSALPAMWLTPAASFFQSGPQQLLRHMMNAGGNQAAWLSRTGAGLAGAALAPIRSRAGANAQRLVYRPAKRRVGKRTAK